MKPLILVRHSLPEVMSNFPAREWPLSVTGTARARSLAERLKTYHPEFIVSSVETKATQTAEIIAASLGQPLQIVEGLHEHDRRDEPFLSPQVFEAKVREFFEQPQVLVFGNESADQAYRRLQSAIYSVLAAQEENTIVVVTHGTVLSLFVSRLTGIHAFSLWKELGLPAYIAVDVPSKSLIAKENIPEES